MLAMLNKIRHVPNYRLSCKGLKRQVTGLVELIVQVSDLGIPFLYNSVKRTNNELLFSHEPFANLMDLENSTKRKLLWLLRGLGCVRLRFGVP